MPVIVDEGSRVGGRRGSRGEVEVTQLGWVNDEAQCGAASIDDSEASTEIGSTLGAEQGTGPAVHLDRVGE